MKKKSKIIIARIIAVLMIFSILPFDMLITANVVMAEELENGVDVDSIIDDGENVGGIDNGGPVSIGGIQDNEGEPDGTDSTDGSDVTDDKDSDNGDNSNGSETTDDEDGDKEDGDKEDEDGTTDPSSDDVNNDEETTEPSKDETSGEQSEAKTYILDPQTMELSGSQTSPVQYGTEGFFTVMAASGKGTSISNIDSIKTGEDLHSAYNPLNWGDYANEKLGNSNIANSERTKCLSITGGSMNTSYASIKIETKYSNAKLVVYGSPKDTSASIAVKTIANGKFVDAFTGGSISNPKVGKNTFTLEKAGVYYVGFSARGGIILYMEVTDDPNAAEPDPGDGNTSGITFTYDEPVMGVKTDVVSFINKSDAQAETANEVNVEKVHLQVETLAATSPVITSDIKTAVQDECKNIMDESDNTDAGAEPIVSYYDMSLINKDEGVEEDKSELQIKDGLIKFKLPYPGNVGLTNKIVVLHDKDVIGEVERVNKDSDGFWVEADSFSPYTIIIEPTEAAKDGKIELTDYSGYAEGAYAEWKPYTKTAHNGYRVAVSKDKTNWSYIDDELIRKYPGYFRADALGLTAGTWYMKIEAVTIGTADTFTPVAENTVKVNVTAHDRSGYAWVGGTSSGAYAEDGSLLPNANVVYITETTKDTVELDVTGADANPCVGLQAILNAYKKGKEPKPLDIRIIGNITDPKVMEKGDILIDKGQKKTGGGITVEGIGEDAVVNGWGIRVKGASNVEIRNLAFMNCDSNEGDNVGLQQDNDHIWVHNCDLFYGDAGSDADQVKGDGALDCKLSNYVTLSYNHFWDSGKSSLLGMKSDKNDEYVTYHHNWFDHSDSRHPRVRFYTAHVYNNYYDGNSKYGVGGALGGGSIFVENNYFRNCKYPMLISRQGSDIYHADGTFSGETGSLIKAYGNTMTGAKRFIAYSPTDDPNTDWDETTDFDAYVASKRGEPVPDTIKTLAGGFSYSNFDTAPNFYKYTPDPASEVPEKVRRNAGRVNGGDLKWTFNNATADTSYAVDMDLKKKCVNYTSKLVSVGGINDAMISIEYTVTFDPNNGQASWEVKVPSGNTVAEPSTDPTTSVEGKSFAGWYKGGNVRWNFSNIVQGNMTLVAIYLGEGEDPPGTGGGDEDDDGDDDDDNNVNTADYVHNFTEKDMESTFYTITGNTSTGKGSVSYKGLTLTKCLKMESGTSISFEAPAEGSLTLVFGGSDSAANQKVKINGTNKNCDANGIYTQKVETGDNIVITKGDGINLFYIEYIPDGYNITINKDDGSANKTIIISKGSELTKDQLPDPARIGYEFKGWVDAETEAPITLPYEPTKNMTIKATWEKDEGSNPGPGPGPGPDDPTPGPNDPSDKDSWTVVLKQKDDTYTYTGSAIKPEFTVYGYNGKVLVEGSDYTVKYSNNINASLKPKADGYDNINAKKQPSITISGKGLITGKHTVTFKIKPKNISKALDDTEPDHSIAVGRITIEKGKKVSTPVVCYNGIKLTAKDYKYVSDADKTKTTFADGDKLNIEGKGNYEGVLAIPIKVVDRGKLKENINKFKVDIDKTEVNKLVYNGSPQDIAKCIKTVTPASGTDKGKDIRTQIGTKYTVVLPNNITDAGTVKFMVVGLEEYSGCTVSKSVKIQPQTIKEKVTTAASEADSDKVTVTGVDKCSYTSAGAVLDDLKVEWKGNELTNGKDYKLSYSGNKKVGNAKYTVTFKGNFKGKVSGGFEVIKAKLEKDSEDAEAKRVKVEISDKVCKENANCKSNPYVTVDGILVKASEYEVTYSVGNVDGTYIAKPKVTFGSDAFKTVFVKIKAKNTSKNFETTGNGNELTGQYTVWKKDTAKKDLSKAKVVFYDSAGTNKKKVAKFDYTGEEVKPIYIEVKVGQDTLTKDVDYTVEYINNVNKGKATVIIKAINGNSKGCIGGKTQTFSIVSRNIKNNPLNLKSLLDDLLNM